MYSYPVRSDLVRDSHATEHAELSVVTIPLVVACGALVACPTLVALTHGWDYRLAVMLGAVLATALACLGWRMVAATRIADRLVLVLAGTLAAALVAVYASDWFDWTPLGLDDALPGMAIGLLLLAVGPVRQALRHEARLPTVVGVALIALALAPAGWAALMYGYHGDELRHAAKYWYIEVPGFGTSIVIAALGFGFALRRRLHATAIALGALAGWDLAVLVFDHGASARAAIVGGTVGAGLMIIATYAWARAARSVPLPHWATLPVGALRAGPAGRALWAKVQMPTAAGLAAAMLGLAPVPWLEIVVAANCFGLSVDDGRLLVVLPGLALGLLLAVLAVVLRSHRLYRAALLTAALIGVQILWLGHFARDHFQITVLLATVTAGGLLSATVAAWRARANGTPARPTGLLALLALVGLAVFMGGIEPLEYFFAAATLGIWWWFYYRRGVPVVAPGAVDRLGRRQSLLRVGLAASLGLMLGAHLLLVEAAARNLTGAMLLAELQERHLYQVSDVAFTRAILADQYLWRDGIAVPRGALFKRFPSAVLEASLHPRDRWSHAGFRWAELLEKVEKEPAYGVASTTSVPGGRLVSYVDGGSPAQRAGVRRGDVIRAIDGVATDGPDAFWGLPSFQPSARLELVSATGEVREVTVAQERYTRTAVSTERVIDVAGRRVGYIELRGFRLGAATDFMDAAERLRGQGIQELVLDLRMNPGGRVDALLRIASAIGGKRVNGKVFERLVHNDRYRDRDEDLVFEAPLRGALSLSRLFVITSGRSCSASEALINGLTPHMEVVTIGGTTCGKPVGSDTLEYGESEYSFITFRAINARGEGDYYNGLRPTCGADNDVRRDFGDPEEASFKAALHYIQHGRCPEPAVWL